MSYSTFGDGGPGIDIYGEFAISIADAVKNGGPVFMIGISNEVLDKEKVGELSRDEKILSVIIGYESANFIVMGGIRDAEYVARRIYKITRKPVGCVEVNPTTLDHLSLRRYAWEIVDRIISAIQEAESSKKQFHIYNPEIDSLEGMIKMYKNRHEIVQDNYPAQ